MVWFTFSHWLYESIMKGLLWCFVLVRGSCDDVSRSRRLGAHLYAISMSFLSKFCGVWSLLYKVHGGSQNLFAADVGGVVVDYERYDFLLFCVFGFEQLFPVKCSGYFLF